MYYVMELLLMLVLFFAAAYCSMVETSLVSLSRVKIKKIIQEYPKKSAGLKIWLENPNKYLTTLLLANDAVTIIGTAIATSIAVEISQKYRLNETIVVAATVIIVWATFLIFGEIVPKILGIHHSERIVKFSINKLYYFDKLISPISKIFIKIAGWVTGKSVKKEIPIITYDDIKTTITIGHEIGVFGVETKQMMHSVLNFSQLTAKSIMSPRDKIEMVNFDTEREKFVDLIVETGHSRVPVYKGNFDNVVGIIYARDLLDMWRSGVVFTTDDLLRPVVFVNEEKKVNELMKQFKKGETHLVLVKSAENKIEGLVTIEDIIEEVFGEILDEYDVAELFRE
ncbi:MAG: hemolysin family protein [Elusimicrobiota bacterium]